MDSERIWSEFTKAHLDDEHARLRRGSRFKLAKPWIKGVSSPAMPTRMLSKVVVYDSWLNNFNMDLANQIVDKYPSLTLRELVEKMLKKMDGKHTSYPYLWWVWPKSKKMRVIHEDANGITFVKLDNKWQMVFSSQVVGVLVGAQGVEGYESLPRNSYFISWENEEIARKHCI